MENINLRFKKCRLCLKIGDFCSIYDQDDSIKLSDMVMSFCKVQIHEGDGLPDHVCATCIESISTAYLFKLQCERIDALLRKQPDTQIDQPDSAHDVNIFFKREFQIPLHNGITYKEKSDDNNTQGNYGQMNMRNKHESETSDETDSDVDSVKCVYCNQSYGNLGHKCHVTCTIEQHMQRSTSSETLVALDVTPIDIQNKENTTNEFFTPPNKENTASEFFTPPDNLNSTDASYASCGINVSCVLCDEKYSEYEEYILHVNKCTQNVKLHHFVCPICHDIFSDKTMYLEHLRIFHFKPNSTVSQLSDPGEDCVDSVPILEKTRHPKPVRRQIGWSIEDIYQEIECKKIDEKPVPASPIKTFFAKFGNESSRHSTPKKVSFRKWIETGKAKTSNYLPFKRYIHQYKEKKRMSSYSSITNRSQVTSKIQATLPVIVSDSDYGSPSGTSEESWKLKQNLICACNKKVFMLSENIYDKERITAMINELGGVVAENTKMEMLATHFVGVLPNDTFTGMMVCALATGKWLLHIGYVYDSFRCKKFLKEDLYEWARHPKVLEIDKTSFEVAKAAVYWHLELNALNAKFPFEGKHIVLIMKKKYRQYYQTVFKTLKAKCVSYDPRTPGICCSADYCFVDMKLVERVKLRFFAEHNVPVFPYQYILVYLLKRGNIENEHKYLLQDCHQYLNKDPRDYFNNTF